jgi:hypothetical protein
VSGVPLPRLVDSQKSVPDSVPDLIYLLHFGAAACQRRRRQGAAVQYVARHAFSCSVFARILSLAVEDVRRVLGDRRLANARQAAETDQHASF